MRHAFFVRWGILCFLLAVLTAPGTAHAATNQTRRVYRDKVEPHWFADATAATNKFWYEVQLPDAQKEFVLVDAAAGKREAAFDHAKLAQALTGVTGKTVDAKKLPFDSITFSPDTKTVVLHGDNADWNVNLENYSVTTKTNGGTEKSQLPAGRTPHPSRNSTTETNIRFVNRLDREVNLFWLDPDGKRQPYGSLKAGENREQHTFEGHAWLVAAKNGDIIAVFDAAKTSGTAVISDSMPSANRRRRESASDPWPEKVASPDQKWEIYVTGDNLFLRDTHSGKEQQLTFDANPDSTYARNTRADRAINMEFETREPAHSTPEIYWAPDSRHFVAMRHRLGADHRVFEVQSSPDEQLQPKLVSFPYLKPGDEIPYAKPHLFEIETRKEIPMDETLFANPWSISDVRWATNSGRFTFLFNQRGHQALRILAVDAHTGAVRPIVDEQSKTFICYSSKFFSEYLDDTSEIIWMSERDGWNHLYLCDAKTGNVKNQITKGEWVVFGVDRVDKEKRQIWFRAGGMVSGENPYFVHYCRVNFDGTGLTILTPGNGTHSVEYSPDYRFAIDTSSRVDSPPVAELRGTEDGKLLCRLEEADASEVFATGWRPPEPFVAKGRDGVTDIYGVIIRPVNFDPTKKYPVIEDIYAGPHDSFVPRAFDVNYRYQNLADKGFIIVRIDGMGTSNRSKKFHDVCWKNLADSGFPDRILWIKSAAAKYPFMDLTRMGIFGTSAGGQSALRGMLDHGDFYKACVSDSGCHDNRMDKIWWNEQWLGWPVDESYVRSSNVVDAHKLQGKLLLMVGEMDNNVDPATTMQVVNALIKADKDFDLLDMPGAGHGVARTSYGARQLVDFFMRVFLKSDTK